MIFYFKNIDSEINTRFPIEQACFKKYVNLIEFFS